MAAVSADGSTVWVLMRRFTSLYPGLFRQQLIALLMSPDQSISPDWDPPRCKAEVGAHVAGAAEPCRVVHAGGMRQGHKRAWSYVMIPICLHC